MFNLKYIKLFIITLLLFLLVYCDQNPLQPEKKKGIPPGFDMIIYFGTLSWGSKEEGNVVDNRDGTLIYTYKLIQTNPYFGNKVLVEKTILIRRCLIGQVYRPTQNDCQGTGTKDTVWGASQLQWCPTNDRSCEKDGKADPAISPAAKACADDTFAGKMWRLRSKDDGLKALLSSSITNDWVKVGYVSGNVWTLESKDAEKVFSAIAFESSLAFKNDSINVLCTGEI